MTIKHIFPPNSHWCNASEYFKGRSHYTFHSIDFHSYTLMLKIGNAISHKDVSQFVAFQSLVNLNLKKRLISQGVSS